MPTQAKADPDLQDDAIRGTDDTHTMGWGWTVPHCNPRQMRRPGTLALLHLCGPLAGKWALLSTRSSKFRSCLCVIVSFGHPDTNLDILGMSQFSMRNSQ